MTKQKIFVFFTFFILILTTSCMTDELQDEFNEDIINDRNSVSENQMDGPGEEEQWDLPDREIVCNNPFFFPQNISFMTAEMSFINIGKTKTFVELSLHWLKQYDNGCLVKLSIVPFDVMPDYMDDVRLSTYFYVTDSEIYRLPSSIMQGDEMITFYNDDAMMASILDTDEKLLEYGTLICCMEEQSEEGENGAQISVSRQGNQIVCNLVDNKESSEIYYENYMWEEGVGLVCYQSGYSAENGEEEEIVYLDEIIYGTTDDIDEKDIVCDNPYFFPQDVTKLTADLTYGDHTGYFEQVNHELELYWLKQYDEGSLVRLSVTSLDKMADYMNMKYINFYFYVTSDKIYRLHFYVASDYFTSFHKGPYKVSEENYYFYETPYGSAGTSVENMDIYIEHNDKLIMSVLNTEERLLKYAELVFSSEDIVNVIGEGESGFQILMSQKGDQVIYSKAYATEYQNFTIWESYNWENGKGLIKYRIGYGAERDPFYMENITYE